MSEYYFNLPSLEGLNPAQRSAQQSPNPIALSGGPGTGKSVVSIYRHLNLISQGKNSQLLTYTNSLALYLKKCCENANKNAAINVTTIFKWLYKSPVISRDEIIIDEAQDVKYAYQLPMGNLSFKEIASDGIYLPKVHVYKEFFKLNFKKVSFGADDSQMLFDGTEYKELHEIFNDNQEFKLQANYRNSKKILRLAFAAFPDANLSETTIDRCNRGEGESPVLVITEYKKDKNVLDFIDSWTDLDAHNIGVLCTTQKEVMHYYDLIKEKYPDCSFFISNGNGLQEIRDIHICTFKSAKGLEFDTVIIPSFHCAFEEFEDSGISWKDFYVGVTRAKSNLYLISNYDLPQIMDYAIIQRDEDNENKDLFDPALFGLMPPEDFIKSLENNEEDDLPF